MAKKIDVGEVRPKAATFYDLTDELREMQDMLTESGGELSEEQEARFNELYALLETKTEGYIAVWRNIQASQEAAEREAARMKRRHVAFQGALSRLKARIVQGFQAIGKDVVETPIGKLRLQYAPQRALVAKYTDPKTELPERYWTEVVHTTTLVNTELIKQDLKYLEELAAAGKLSTTEDMSNVERERPGIISMAYYAELAPPTPFVRLY